MTRPPGAGTATISEVAQSSSSADFSTSLAPQWRLPLVMLVEDDPAVAQMYKLGLEAAGFEVAVHEDGSAFFAAIESQIPDIVILDFHLQGLLTGIDIAENLRLDERFGRLPVLFLSNECNVSREDTDRASGAGALAWLAKSRTSPSQLATRIAEALDSCTAEGSC